jgi:purine-binding chemotaxis protein CheW
MVDLANDEFVGDDEVGLFVEQLSASQGATQDDTEGADASVLLSQSVDAERQYITFTIDNEEYGTPILTVQEIRGWMKTTPLPNTPDFVKGVTNLRGNIVPVFDLRARFSGEETEVSDRHVVIMVEIEGRTIGLLVDAISDILTIDQSQIQPPPTGNLLVDTQYLDGLVASGERMVALVSIHKLFDTDVLQSIAAQSASATLQDVHREA